MYVFIFRAAIYCEDCGHSLLDQRKEYAGAEDSDVYPQGPFGEGGGEADTPQHCDSCGVFLDNPLTGDGETYVRDAFNDYVDCGSGLFEVLADWKLAYGWCFDDYAEITLPLLIEDRPLTDTQQARFDKLESI